MLRIGWAEVVFASMLLLISRDRALSESATILRRYEFNSPHMGTEFTIKVYAATPEAAQAAAGKALQRVEELEQVMSDYRADSELMTLCEQPSGKPVRVSGDLFHILEICQKYSELSDGAFDVTVGPYVRLWRFSRKRKTLPTKAELLKAAEAVGWRKLKIDATVRTVTLTVPNMRLDLGGIGKGFAADEALKVIKSAGLSHALVAASGDIAIGDAPPGKKGWRIAIGGSTNAMGSAQQSVVLANAGISTSGDAEQYVEINGKRYSHIVDPKTGLGLTSGIQATVVSSNSTITDALDTTLSVLGVKRALKLVDSLPATAALLIDPRTGRVSKSKRWKSFEQR
jgi:thiamine biosynthesis lipoprotein